MSYISGNQIDVYNILRRNVNIKTFGLVIGNAGINIKNTFKIYIHPFSLWHHQLRTWIQFCFVLAYKLLY